MNLPNKLTVSRFVLTFALLSVLFSQLPFRESLALVLFVSACLTDYCDGIIARRQKIITNFGILMDPLADKVLTSSLFIAFVGLGQMRAWMVCVIVVRELAITGLRLLAASKNIVLAAEGLGKHKTTSQMVAISAILTSLSYPEWGAWAKFLFGLPILGTPWIRYLTELSKWIAVLLTFLSGFSYLWRNREIYLKEM
jgi:CDP-diacylglycerol--glycerol-3-phosphate 3-phosphatidyltransferase